MIHWDFKKIATSVLTVLGIGTLTSCYGMVPNRAFLFVNGKISSRENSGASIRGIKVELRDGDKIIDTDFSDEDGEYCLGFEDDYLGIPLSISFSDVDGNENGRFKNQTREIKLEQFETTVDAELESDESGAE